MGWVVPAVAKPAKGACFYCGKLGHFKRDCRKLKAQKLGKGASREGSGDSRPKVLLAHTTHKQEQGMQAKDVKAAPNLVGDRCWYVDSGASRHMCCQGALFLDFVTCQQKDILVGDGRALPVTASGTVRLRVHQRRGRACT